MGFLNLFLSTHALAIFMTGIMAGLHTALSHLLCGFPFSTGKFWSLIRTQEITASYHILSIHMGWWVRGSFPGTDTNFFTVQNDETISDHRTPSN
jgi:hypothetical protein